MVQFCTGLRQFSLHAGGLAQIVDLTHSQPASVVVAFWDAVLERGTSSRQLGSMRSPAKCESVQQPLPALGAQDPLCC
jgi:hypothetical protein